MKKSFTIVLFIIACAAMMMAQTQGTFTPPAGGVGSAPQAPPTGGTWTPSGTAVPVNQTTIGGDVLGAHLVYGRGCVACHAPHSGAAGNGNGTGTNSGNVALWGQNLYPLFGATISFGGAVNNGTTVTGGYSVTLPASQATMSTSASDPTNVILFCLSCHDGNVARPGMMRGVSVETLPVVGGNAPTFLGNDGSGAGNYSNDHPVGLSATIGCNSASSPESGYNWDCSISGNTLTPGPNMTQFEANYGFTVKPAWVNGTAVVTCTTCHNQHSNFVYNGKINNVSGFYQTAFFISGYYNPSSGGNSAAQFCRNCHGGESNEMNGQPNVKTW